MIYTPENLRPLLPEPEKLRVLADYFDRQYPDHLNSEVQQDLRAWADSIERILNEE
jgi:hypothetical protein